VSTCVWEGGMCYRLRVLARLVVSMRANGVKPRFELVLPIGSGHGSSRSLDIPATSPLTSDPFAGCPNLDCRGRRSWLTTYAVST
jgi:hypothetical protein